VNVIWYTDSSFKRQSAQHSNSALLTKGPPWKGSTERSKVKDNLIEEIAGTTQRICLKCKTQLEGRPNKRFCSGNCRKRYSEHTRNAKFSPTKHRESVEFFDRALRLAEIVYTTPPQERLGLVKGLIDEARYGDDKHLRDILSNRYLLQAHPYREPHLFYRRRRSYLTIAQIARNYCKRFWRADVKEVVYGRAPEPADGVVDEKCPPISKGELRKTPK